MARINRSDVIQKAVNDLALSVSADKIPTETLDKVQLTYSLNRHYSSFVVNTQSTATGTITCTMPTIDPRSEIFITSIDFDLMKDSTCDLATGTTAVVVTSAEQQVVKSILQIATITLTAQSNHAHVDFAFPLRVKPNTNITNTCTTTLGVLVRGLSVTGFISSTN